MKVTEPEIMLGAVEAATMSSGREIRQVYQYLQWEAEGTGIGL